MLIPPGDQKRYVKRYLKILFNYFSVIVHDILKLNIFLHPTPWGKWAKKLTTSFFFSSFARVATSFQFYEPRAFFIASNNLYFYLFIFLGGGDFRVKFFLVVKVQKRKLKIGAVFIGDRGTLGAFGNLVVNLFKVLMISQFQFRFSSSLYLKKKQKSNDVSIFFFFNRW